MSPEAAQGLGDGRGPENMLISLRVRLPQGQLGVGVGFYSESMNPRARMGFQGFASATLAPSTGYEANTQLTDENVLHRHYPVLRRQARQTDSGHTASETQSIRVIPMTRHPVAFKPASSSPFLRVRDPVPGAPALSGI